MAKNYILEPIEVEFEDLGGQGINGEIDSVINPTEYTKLVAALNSIELGHTLLLGNLELQYAGLMDTNYTRLFTEDGTIPQSQPEHFLIIVPYSDYFVLKIMEPAGTYTISIYTGEDDPEPTPTDNPFSKNIVHNDHPYNAVERIRAKLKKVEQGEDEDESGEGEEESGGDEGGGTVSGGGIMKLTFTEDPDAVNPGTYVCDHTWQEIHDALNNGDIVHGPINVDAIVSEGMENLTISIDIKLAVYFSDGQYTLTGWLGISEYQWSGASADEHPTATLG